MSVEFSLPPADAWVIMNAADMIDMYYEYGEEPPRPEDSFDTEALVRVLQHRREERGLVLSARILRSGMSLRHINEARLNSSREQLEARLTVSDITDGRLLVVSNRLEPCFWGKYNLKYPEVEAIDRDIHFWLEHHRRTSGIEHV